LTENYHIRTKAAASKTGAVDYRFGFNGMMKDNEVKGIGNSLDFGERWMDTRTVRLGMSRDPLYRKFPWQSPYVFAGNNPVYYIDEKGEKKTTYIQIIDQQSGTTTKLTLVTPGLIARSTKSMHSGIRSWNWFDYSETVTINIDKEGKMTLSQSAPKLGDYRINTSLKSEKYAMGEVGENRVKDTRMYDGWIGTSGDGGGEDNSFNPNAGPGSKYVDYGRILKTISSLQGFTRQKPGGVIQLVGDLNTAVGLGSGMATDNDKAGIIDVDGRTDKPKSRLKYCEDCGGYVKPDSSLTEEKPATGETVDTVNMGAHK
jgi:hypothetical protein